MSISGFVDDAGVTRIPTSALSDDALTAFTLLCVSGSGLVKKHPETGKPMFLPDGTPVPDEEAGSFMVGWLQTYKRPWGNDSATRALWAAEYRRGVDELVALGIVEQPKFNVMGEPEVDDFGFPKVGAFHRDRVQRGFVELKEGPSS